MYSECCIEPVDRLSGLFVVFRFGRTVRRLRFVVRAERCQSGVVLETQRIDQAVRRRKVSTQVCQKG